MADMMDQGTGREVTWRELISLPWPKINASGIIRELFDPVLLPMGYRRIKHAYQKYDAEQGLLKGFEIKKDGVSRFSLIIGITTMVEDDIQDILTEGIGDLPVEYYFEEFPFESLGSKYLWQRSRYSGLIHSNIYASEEGFRKHMWWALQKIQQLILPMLDGINNPLSCYTFYKNLAWKRKCGQVLQKKNRVRIQQELWTTDCTNGFRLPNDPNGYEFGLPFWPADEVLLWQSLLLHVYEDALKSAVMIRNHRVLSELSQRDYMKLPQIDMDSFRKQHRGVHGYAFAEALEAYEKQSGIEEARLQYERKYDVHDYRVTQDKIEQCTGEGVISMTHLIHLLQKKEYDQIDAIVAERVRQNKALCEKKFRRLANQKITT